ncbi:hypothetical protein CEY16_14010 [Halalkalibacillus sediminis]|uniref:Uncharacterized protein n=1 Tax=Halalkalibacillus sediminis TaxID=2018042 RepID=A0A2I0QRF3_9BACI|nr:hypothetical protein [Halalkalibacillus sediminis]PKR76916.1 hypothetical protein CEY16_14010 [Halalkalibacillus sediminis]
MNKYKILSITLSLAIVITLFLAFHFYQEKKELEIAQGAEYRSAFMTAHFQLESLLPEDAEDIQQHREDDSVLFVFGRMNQLTSTMMTNWEGSMLARQIKVLVRMYRSGENNHEEIIKKHNYIVTTLNTVIEDLGEDPVTWFEELTTENSDTNNFIWDEFKKHEDSQ